jgi:hypothetical protein
MNVLATPLRRLRKTVKRDPKPDSWEWERARRAVANLLRRVLWRVNREKPK